MKRKFYLIGHNPDTLEEAQEQLQAGANALGPDVHYDEESGQFQVYHLVPSPFGDITLQDYLSGLKMLLHENSSYRLSLLAFDLKPDYNYKLSDLQAFIFEHFSKDYPAVTIITTINDPAQAAFFESASAGMPANYLIGIDEDSSAEEAHQLLNDKGIAFIYGNGISAPLIDTTNYAGEIQKAIQLRNAGNSFKLVYAWTVNAEASMRTYLDMDIDGIITDDVAQLKALLQQPEYVIRYELA